MRRSLIGTCALALVACGGETTPSGGQPAEDTASGFEPPVLVNPESPVAYPLALFEREVEGSVVLRLFISADGSVQPESTQVAEGSGYPALDSAALAGVADMIFAPARRDGVPVATLFLQPIHFRHPAQRNPSGENP